jgi:chemotaxis protein CheD
VKAKRNSLQADGLSPALPGFEHISRYWDDQHGCVSAKILPGEFYVTRHDELLVTVLGSCVSACIRDRETGIGGMNHFMLPVDRGGSGSWDGCGLDVSTHYGSHAMESLITNIIKHGGSRENLEVKIFGGGRILGHMTDIGKKNIEFVRSYIRFEGLRLVAEDVGGVYPRKVYYLPATGKAFVKKLVSVRNDTIAEREKAYLDDLARKPVEGDVTLF